MVSCFVQPDAGSVYLGSILKSQTPLSVPWSTHAVASAAPPASSAARLRPAVIAKRLPAFARPRRRREVGEAAQMNRQPGRRTAADAAETGTAG